MAAPNCLAKKADKCWYQNSAAVGNREEFWQRAAFAQVQQLACTVWFCLWETRFTTSRTWLICSLADVADGKFGTVNFSGDRAKSVIGHSIKLYKQGQQQASCLIWSDPNTCVSNDNAAA